GDPISLPSGTHSLRFELENHLTESRTVTVGEREEARLGIYLQPMSIWNTRLPQDDYTSLLSADLNRDGVPDWIVQTRTGGATAVDGARAVRLWETPGGREEVPPGVLVDWN